jgi:Tol biopolymer transport system component
MDADGSNKHQITSLGRDLKPAWSPDGQQLLFIRQQSNLHGDLYRMPVDGGKATRLTRDGRTTGGDDNPTWSPDGQQVLFLQYRKRLSSVGWQLAVIKTLNVATLVETRVPAGIPKTETDVISSPDFMPDGEHIVFIAGCPTKDYCYPANVNVMTAGLVHRKRTEITSQSGVDGEWDSYTGVVATPSGHTILTTCENFDPRIGDYTFCGIRPGGVRDATNPDQQPLP